MFVTLDFPAYFRPASDARRVRRFRRGATGRRAVAWCETPYPHPGGE